MPTPHENFLASSHPAAIKPVLDTVAFDHACETALLMLVEEMPEGGDNPNTDWANYCRLRGARRVLEILRAIHRRPEPPKPNRFPTLTPPK